VIRSIARLVVLTMSATCTALVGVGVAHAAPEEGWIRLAHLSPDTPKVDVYVSSFGNDDNPTVLRSVGYGMFSPYQHVPAGSFTIAMRLEGASASEPPVLSTTVQLRADSAVTVAGMGKNTDLELVTLTDDLEAPGTDKSKVRVIHAALKAPVVDSVELAGTSVAADLDFAAFTDYDAVAAGTTTVAVDAGSATAEEPLDLRAGATYTVVVRDLESGIGVLPIQDFAAANQIPTGAVDAGLGGSASGGLLAPWALVGLALVAAACAGLTVSRRPRAGSVE
jgi:Domain of unknown function (DUF4397)